MNLQKGEFGCGAERERERDIYFKKIAITSPQRAEFGVWSQQQINGYTENAKNNNEIEKTIMTII
jgi:hypothetical protein